MGNWDGLFVPEPVIRSMQELGFSDPTPIQRLVLPSAIRDFKDIIGAAETVRFLYFLFIQKQLIQI